MKEPVHLICDATARWCALCEVLGSAHTCVVRMHHVGALACVADGPGPSEPQPLTIGTFLMTLTVDSLTHVNQVMRSPFSDIARIMIHIKGMPNIIWIADVRNNGGCAPYPASNEGSKVQHHQRSLYDRILRFLRFLTSTLIIFFTTFNLRKPQLHCADVKYNIMRYFKAIFDALPGTRLYWLMRSG